MRIVYDGNRSTIDLDKQPYICTSHNLLDYEWSYYEQELLNNRGSLIYNFGRKLRSYTMTIRIVGDPFEEVLDELINTFEEVVLSAEPGHLYIGDDYLECYITASNQSNWKRTSDYIDATFTVVSPNAIWINEAVFAIYPGSTNEVASGGKNYPYSYKYKYTKGGDCNVLKNTGLSPSKAKIEIYGYAKNPSIYIGGHEYTVFDTVQEGERIVIDQLKRTVTKVYENGQADSIFNKRGKVKSVFEPIPRGSTLVTTNSNFKVRIVMYNERSTPRWRT